MRNRNLNWQELKAVAFDWDNTLAQTRGALVRCIGEVLTAYGLPAWSLVKQRCEIRLSFRENFPLIFGSKAGEAYDMYRRIYLEKAPETVTEMPGAKEVLQFFHNHQIPVTVVSNKDRELLEDELPRLFDPLLFDTIVCGHEAPRDKPAPQQLQFAVQKYVGASDITPDNVWMIGDSLMDSECGLAAHAQPILIGKPIWHNVTEVSYKIWHYDNFMQMYQDLVREND